MFIFFLVFYLFFEISVNYTLEQLMGFLLILTYFTCQNSYFVLVYVCIYYMHVLFMLSIIFKQRSTQIIIYMSIVNMLSFLLYFSIFNI